jgi:hypothetical protein
VTDDHGGTALAGGRALLEPARQERVRERRHGHRAVGLQTELDDARPDADRGDLDGDGQ